jgi:hypothetical protein
MKTKSRPLFRKLATFATVLAGVGLTAASAWAAGSSSLVIAEVYGGGGNASATYKNDYVVVFNRSNANVDVSGWSVQYGSASGTTWQVTPLATSGKFIPPGGYFLVQEASGGAVGTTIPTPDATGTINMSATSGKVALVNSTTALSGALPTGPSLIDLVGFGTANGFEGAAAAGAGNATSVQRNSGGCSDSDNNGADCIVAAPTPRNSTTAPHSCAVVVPPAISGVSQSTANANAGNNVYFTVTLSAGDTPFSYYWYKQAGASMSLIPGATSATLALANVIAADATNYQVVVSNASTINATSSIVSLTVADPAINVQPAANQTDLLGSTAFFTVKAGGTPAVTYQWYQGTPSPGANTPLSNGGRIAGATSPTLTIANLGLADANTYFVVVNNGLGTVTSTVATLAVVDTAGVLAYWDFNTPGLNPISPGPAQGDATAVSTLVMNTNGFLPATGGGSPSDPIASVLGATNYYWGTASYPTQGTSNKQVGVQFAVSTVGMKNVAVSYDTRCTTTSSKYERLQYTTNGTDFIDYPVSTAFTSASSFQHRTASLAGFPGVRNNPNFAIRVVSEFESTATYGASGNAGYLGYSSTYSTAGTLSKDIVTITADAITSGNTAPTISAIADQSVTHNSPITVNFTVGDAETAAGSLTVSATSYDQSLVADGSIVPGGSGSSRNITITPNGTDGKVPILVTVTDAAGDATATWFTLVITPLDLPPTITPLPYTNTLVGTAITIAFNVGDDLTAVGSLTLSANSLNTSLVPNASVVFGGSGTNRTVTITPAAKTVGVAPITISVSDGTNAPVAAAFTLMVRPSTNVVFNDYFDYADGALTNGSVYFWNTHSGTAGQTQVAGNHLAINQNLSEDCNAKLIGQPYMTNSGLTLYSSFKVIFTTLPTEGGTYFEHYLDLASIGSGAGTAYGARVWSSTLNAGANMYRLGIANGSGGTNTSGQFPLDLSTNTEYTVVTRFVLSNGVATIWINPSSETSSGVTATDATQSPGIVENAINVTSVATRQGAGEGIMTIDKLRVGFTFDSVVDLIHANVSGANAVLTWDNAAMTLQSATTVSGPYTNVVGATSPYTTPVGAQTYFRLNGNQ